MLNVKVNRQALIFLLLIIALALGAYVWFGRGSGSPITAPTEDTTIEEIETRISNVRRLKTIELDTALFQDEAFRGLVNFVTGTDVIIQPGRKNPFSPF